MASQKTTSPALSGVPPELHRRRQGHRSPPATTLDETFSNVVVLVLAQREGTAITSSIANMNARRLREIPECLIGIIFPKILAPGRAKLR